MEKISLDNKFAVKVGKLWVDARFSNYELTTELKDIYSFKKALEVQENTGGSIHTFIPSEINADDLEALKEEMVKE